MDLIVYYSIHWVQQMFVFLNSYLILSKILGTNCLVLHQIKSIKTWILSMNNNHISHSNSNSNNNNNNPHHNNNNLNSNGDNNKNQLVFLNLLFKVKYKQLKNLIFIKNKMQPIWISKMRDINHLLLLFKKEMKEMLKQKDNLETVQEVKGNLISII